MTTKPAACEEQGPASSHEEQVNDPLMPGEMGENPDSSPHDETASRAEPEEDVDVLEPGGPDVTQGTLAEIVEAPQLSEALQAHVESDINLTRQDASPPPPPLSASSPEEDLKKEDLSNLEDWKRDPDIISDPTVDPLYPENPKRPPLTETVDREEESTSEEMTGGKIRTEENSAQLNSSNSVFNVSEPDSNSSGVVADGTNSPSHDFPPDLDKSDDVCSPPVADESEEEEETNMGNLSCQHILGDAKVSLSTDPTAALPAVPSAQQKGELLAQELAPGKENQEVAQQVIVKTSAPLSTVAMELSNQGGAASEGSGCVVIGRERHSRAGERAEGGSDTCGVEGQKESGLEKNKLVGKEQDEGRFTYSVQMQERKTEIFSCSESSNHIRQNRMDSYWCDDGQSDSGVSEDFSPSSTLGNNSTEPQAALTKETPIQREIRRSVEREQSLRRSRGLPNQPTSPEYVEIPNRKTFLGQSLPANSEKLQNIDRQFAGKKMHHEMHEEAQREQDLVKLGKLPGIDHKGTVRQLKERKQLFEAFQKPSDSTLNVSSRSRATSWSLASEMSTLENKEDISSQASTIRRSESIELLSPTQRPNSAKRGGSTASPHRGPGFSEGKNRQVIILENNQQSAPAQKFYHIKIEAEDTTTVNSGAPYVLPSRTGGHGRIIEREQEKEEELPSKENPFFKLRSSTNVIKVETDIREAQEREKELQKQRISLYGGAEDVNGGGSERPASMNGKKLNGLAVPDLPSSSSRGGTG